MSTASIPPIVPAPLTAKRVEHPTHDEWYLTGRPSPGAGILGGAVEVFAAAAIELAHHDIAPLHEKIYATRHSRDAILEQRELALAARGHVPDWPVTVLEGTPGSATDFGGFQLWGVTPKPDSGQRVDSVVVNGTVMGREWIGPDFRELVLASIDGGVPDDSETNTATDQARRMFETSSAVLGARGYSFGQVARTWIYLSHLLDWYGDFNRVRTAHYMKVGLTTAEDAVFPASTGIQARHDREECLMDLLAVHAGAVSDLRVRPVLESERQGRPFAYGSAFARAMVIERGKKKTIHVSGTASIDAAGLSKHPGDAAAQFCETLLGVAAVLEREGGSLADIAQGTLFVKTPAIAAVCREVSRRLRLPELPLLEIVADVCRPELLVEIEAVALV
jgi:enamine deaminase RidA (YjgF/YER057c/UK114 family)